MVNGLATSSRKRFEAVRPRCRVGGEEGSAQGRWPWDLRQRGRERELRGSLHAAGSKRKGAYACAHPLAPDLLEKENYHEKEQIFGPVVPLDFVAPRSVDSRFMVADCVHAFVEWLHRWQEFIGGLIGAAGAVWAVYLTLGRQRKEETEKVSSAVATEVTALAKYVMGAVEICIEIAKGTRRVPQTDAGYIVRKVLAEPTIYTAVADRVGLLPRPEATTQFYLRIEEVKVAASAVETAVKFQWAPSIGGPPPLMTRDLLLPIADILITALQLARPIIGDTKTGSGFGRRVREVTVKQIDECLATAKQAFPDAESFADAGGEPWDVP